MDQMTLLRFEWRQARRRATQSRKHGDRAGELIATGQAEALYRALVWPGRASSPAESTVVSEQSGLAGTTATPTPKR